jgi:hypothetical protein
MKKLLFLLLPIFGFSQTVQEAKAYFAKDVESYDGKKILDKIIAKEPNNAEAYYEAAKYYAGKQMMSYVRENINKAIQLSPENTDYRWIRANAIKDDFQIGIDDLNFMISKGVETGKVYYQLGVLSYEYAKIIKYQPKLKPDYSPNYRNAENEKILADNKVKVKELLETSKYAFEQYESITGQSAETYFVDLERIEKN